MRAQEFLNEAAGMPTQLYAPHPGKINESFGLKPQVKIWTSTAIETPEGITSEWVRWCEDAMPEWVGDTGFLFDVAASAKILTIRSDQDAIQIARHYGVKPKNPVELMTGMAWAAIGKDYDAVHYTAENWWQDTVMRPWDMESTAWFNPGVLGNKRQVRLAREEPIDEMAGKIHGGIRKVLMNKGYRYLGGGIDKQAYLEPNGQVYIVFGYRQGTLFDFSPDQRMFLNWIDYCNKHQDNPHLPRFSGFESFEFQGRTYIQARMETLQDLPDDVGLLVGSIEDAIKKINIKNIDKAFEILSDYASVEDPGFYTVEKSIELLGGPESAKNLLKTVKTVQQFARKHNYSIDLHRGNYMARPDGTIVVNDPFVIWERNL